MKKQRKSNKRQIKIISVVFFCIGLFSCAINVPIEKKAPLNNATYKVEYLFEYEGCKMYRFNDNGHYIYFSNCQGNVISLENDSTETRVITNKQK